MIREFDDSNRDEENHVHGRRPQNKNREYGSRSPPRKPGRITEKTNE